MRSPSQADLKENSSNLNRANAWGKQAISKGSGTNRGQALASVDSGHWFSTKQKIYKSYGHHSSAPGAPGFWSPRREGKPWPLPSSQQLPGRINRDHILKKGQVSSLFWSVLGSNTKISAIQFMSNSCNEAIPGVADPRGKNQTNLYSRRAGSAVSPLLHSKGSWVFCSCVMLLPPLLTWLSASDS